MPGEINSHRQYTTSNFTPFHFYTPAEKADELNKSGNFIPLERSANADKNTLLVLPFNVTTDDSDNVLPDTTSTSAGSISLCMLTVFQVPNADNTATKGIARWMLIETKDISTCKIAKFENLLAAPYKLVYNGTAKLNIAFNDEPITTVAPNGLIDFAYGHAKSILPPSVYTNKIEVK